MREKYIDEALGTMFIFGESPDGLRVDLHREGLGCSADLASSIKREDAERLIADRDRLMRTIYELANGWDAADSEGFKHYWYDTRGE